MSKMVKLKDVFAKPISGEWGDEVTDDNYVKIIKTNNILNTGKISYEKITIRDIDSKKIEAKKLNYGDILIEKSGGSPANPVGRVCFFDKKDEEYLTNNFMSTLRVLNKSFHHQYVFYNLFYLYQKRVVLKFQNQTTGIINLKLTRYLDEIEIKQINFTKQKEIASILDKAQELISLRKESIKKLDELSKSIFIDMFGDPVSNPKKWNISCLSKLGVTLEGGKNIAANPDDINIKNHILKISAITLGFFRSEEVKPLPNSYSVPNNYFVKQGDLLMSRANTSLLVGATALVWNKYDNLVLPDKIWRIRIPENTQINKIYYWKLAQTKAIKDEIASRASGTGGSMKNITKPKTLSIPIILPPLDLQNKFAKTIEKIEEQKKLYEEELEKLEENFKALLQKSFN